MKNQAENLILIARPINFLFALEVVKRHEKEQFIILIYPNSHPQEKKACDFLMNEFEKYFTNAEFIYFNPPFKNDFINLHFFNFWMFLKYSKRKIKLFSTSGGVKGRIVYKHAEPEKFLLTDEGTSSLKKFPKIIKTQRFFPLGEKNFYKRLYKSLGVYDLKNSKEFKILTIFETLDNFEGGIEYIQMDNWKNILKNRNFDINTEEIIILGSVPDSLNMEYSTYKKIIDRIYNENRGKQIWFKPHKNFLDNLGYQELKTELPIEYYFLQRNSIPHILYSFGSTSNTLLKNIFSEITTLDLTQ